MFIVDPPRRFVMADPMIRRLIVVLTLLATLAVPLADAWAQPTRPAAAPPTAPPAAMSAEQARLALEVLNDPAKRAALIAALQAVAKQAPAKPTKGAAPQPNDAGATQATAPPEEPKPDTKTLIPLAPDGLGAQLLVSASALMTTLGDRLRDALRAVESVPLLYGWAVVMVTSPLARAVLMDATWRVVVALVLACAALYGTHLIIRPVLSRLEQANRRRRRKNHAESEPDRQADEADTPVPTGPVDQVGTARAEAGESEPPRPYRPGGSSAVAALRLLPFLLARFVLELIPVLALLVVGHLVAASSLGGQTTSKLIILAIVDATAASAALIRSAHIVLSPDAEDLAFLDLPHHWSTYLWRWVRRLVIIGVFGYGFGEVGYLLGLSDVAYSAVQKTVGLILVVCIMAIAIRNRRVVRRWIQAPSEAKGLMASIRNHIARSWHWILVFVLAANWLAWAIGARGQAEPALRLVLQTAAILIIARIVQLAAVGLSYRLMHMAGESSSEAGGDLTARLRLYHPPLSAIITAVIYVTAFLVLLQVYGTGGLVWLLSSDLGQRFLSALLMLGITVAIAIMVWEAANLAIHRHLAKLSRDAQTARSARLRTLLPLLRSTLIVVIGVVAGMMILSEIGVNIAPLLAGAGIIGIAIGFGSQRLVQDLITGIFLLLENAMQVGDVVMVGSQAGLVESLSVRTIRLRAEDGSVHVIPFSAVTTVTNLTRDYSRAVLEIGIGYDSDYEKACEIMQEVVRDMRADPQWKSIIQEDLELYGLDQFADSGIIIKGRIKCIPFGRWSVGREFRRRVKVRFEQSGIEIPYPYRKLVISGPTPPEVLAGMAGANLPQPEPKSSAAA